MIATKTIDEAISVRAGSLEARAARNFAEIDAAMKLRFEVFNLELNEGLSGSYERGYDTDAYDAYCDHLIVEDTETGRVVGTYRLLLRSRADRNIGFYSENEFDISNLKSIPGEILELGRSCIAASHRSFATISLLWAAISKYAAAHGVNYMFGCASLHSSDRDEVRRVYSHLSRNHMAPERFRVHPLDSCRMEMGGEVSEESDIRDGMRKTPAILKGYLRAGAVICGPPAYDAEFGTADLLVLHEMSGMTSRYRNHYAAGSRN